jgi:hypothetical protein
MTLGFRPVHPSIPTSDTAGSTVLRSGGGGGTGPRPRLDDGTKLVDGCMPVGWGPGWVVKWYPDAHEATIYFRGAHDGGAPPVGAAPGPPEDTGPVDTEANQLRAERRARTKVRLYASANGIDRLITLTYAPPFCTDPATAYDGASRFGGVDRNHHPQGATEKATAGRRGLIGALFVGRRFPRSTARTPLRREAPL